MHEKLLDNRPNDAIGARGNIACAQGRCWQPKPTVRFPPLSRANWTPADERQLPVMDPKQPNEPECPVLGPLAD
jgi:hypothetical protein